MQVPDQNHLPLKHKFAGLRRFHSFMEMKSF